MWAFEVLSTGSILFALHETYDDTDTPDGFRYTLAYAFAANIIVYSCIVPALRTKVNRVTFMAILDFVTNVPVIVVALGTGSHLGKLAVPILLLLCVLQCCHDMVYEVVRTMHDECERRELEKEQSSSMELGESPGGGAQDQSHVGRSWGLGFGGTPMQQDMHGTGRSGSAAGEQGMGPQGQGMGFDSGNGGRSAFGQNRY